jgi:hypothetical protein
MKKLFFLFLVVFTTLTSFNVQAQNFYETQFKSGGVLYDVLVIFYDDNDVLIRTRYMLEKQYMVAEYKATAQVLEDGKGTSGYMIDGKDAKIVYGDKTRSYSADNYIFYKDENGEWGKPYIMDDSKPFTTDRSAMVPVNFWRQIDPAKKFTEQYVYNYFDRDESLRNVLLAYNPSNVASVAGVNGGGNVAGGIWKVFMSKGTGYGVQSWVTRYEFPKEKVKEYWAQGKGITSIGYGNGLWFICMSKQSGYSRQSYKYGTAWPNEWIEKKWADSKRITDLTYGNGQWALVMSAGSGYTDQIYSISKKWPKAWLTENWREGKYSITSIAYGAGHWAVVLSVTPGKNPAQRIRAGVEFPAADVKECQAEGFDVTTLAYGDEWVTILTKGVNLTQNYSEGSSFPKQYVKEKWGQGYAISEVIYKHKEAETDIVLNFTGTASTAGTSNNTIVHSNSTNSTSTTTTIAAVPRLHLITVANTKVPDIGSSCEVDRNNVHDEFSDITSGLGIELKKHTIDGTNLTKGNVTSAIRNMNVKPNDIVIFIYSGHGYRWSNQSSQYPQMALFYSRYDSPSKSNSLNLKEVYDMIVAKGARLNIVLGDCCNNDIGVTSRSGGGGLSSRSYTRGSLNRLRQLFFKERGNIIAAAAQPNETACGSQGSGGYFLNAFFSAIDRAASYTATGTPTWGEILNRTMSSATYKTQNLNGCDVQHGVFKSTGGR